MMVVDPEDRGHVGPGRLAVLARQVLAQEAFADRLQRFAPPCLEAAEAKPAV